jgi:hypothetical protein
VSVMKASARKPFQEATVEHVLDRLRDRHGSRRFLVADEVGLGKTLVAQGVIEGLLRRKREPLRVFYMCSSLAIAAQNKRRLLESIADDAQREQADVHADRLDLLPSVEISGKPPFFLYSLTPHTTAGDGTGRVDERVVIGKALQEISATLGRKRAFLDKLRWPAGARTWEARWAEVEIQDRGVLKHFRGRVCEEIGRGPHAWEQTIAEEVERRLEEDTRVTVEALRRAMTLAVLDALCPDVVILDEFQRFFEMLPPPEHDDDDEENDGEGSRTAHDVMRAVLGAQRPRNERPAVLMLSATPYRLFARTREGQQHHTEFFLLMSFLYDDDREDKALRDLFARYRGHLMLDEPGSTAVFGVKNEIEERLLRVMCRTERSRLAGDSLPAPISARREIRLEADDVRVYRHLDDSAEGVGFGVEPYWSSIPFPLQAMDQRYALRAHAKVAPLRAGERHLRLDFRVIQRYGAQRYPHPRLRGLIEQLPGDVLCLPWLPPSRAWWPLGGPFARMPAGACSKALVFSRFRAIPRILSAVLSYEAERAAFGEETSRRQPYDYFARTRAGAQREDITGQAPRRRLGRGRLALKRQPAPSFGLSARGRHGENRRTLLLFLPAPELAALADPLTFDRSGVEALTCERAVALVRARLRDMLGEASDAEPRPRGRLWRWVATIEGRARDPEAFRGALEGWAQAVAKAHPGAAQTCRELRDEMARPLAPVELPTGAELDELADLALLGPGNVLLRAVARVFGDAADLKARLMRLLGISLLSLRTYLDAPEWHLFLRARDGQRHRGGHAERVRRAVWDGNLEAVLDEYLAVLQGLGTAQPDAAREQGALENLGSSAKPGSNDLGKLSRMRPCCVDFLLKKRNKPSHSEGRYWLQRRHKRALTHRLRRIAVVPSHCLQSETRRPDGPAHEDSNRDFGVQWVESEGGLLRGRGAYPLRADRWLRRASRDAPGAAGGAPMGAALRPVRDDLPGGCTRAVASSALARPAVGGPADRPRSRAHPRQVQAMQGDSCRDAALGRTSSTPDKKASATTCTRSGEHARDACRCAAWTGLAHGATRRGRGARPLGRYPSQSATSTCGCR